MKFHHPRITSERKSAIIGNYFKSRAAASNYIANRKRTWHTGNSIKWIVLESLKGFIVVDERYL